MTQTHETLSAEHRTEDTATLFGFWMYLMSDFILFAALFAVYAVFRSNTFGGPIGSDIFKPTFVLTETIILLSSSFVCGISILAARAGSVHATILSLIATIALGASFVGLEYSEFARLISQGSGPSRSGFLSAYFTLVGSHGLHVTLGLFWALALIIAIARYKLTRSNMRKLVLFNIFWHFLDIIWVFIFSIVYLLGII